jgi:tetratricopeptide (TPR) repeat protein
VKARARAFLGILGIVSGIGLAATVLHARETRAGLPAATAERLMYLRSGGTADRVFLSFDTIAADVYWIRTIQHYGRDRSSQRTTGRFELLQPLLDLTTTLDPHFNIAYRFGAIFLSLSPPNGPGRTDQAVALLEKGLGQRPNRWQYAHDIGFIHYWYTGDYSEAARWFRQAADMPGAPEWIRPLAATTLAQGGDRDGARRLLSELRESPETYIRQAAERSLAQLQALEAIDQLEARIEQFHARVGRYPDGWVDMVRAGALGGLPRDPSGAPFFYDPETRQVTLSPDSSLAPLPPAFERE